MDFKSFYKKVTNPFRAKSTIYSGGAHHGSDFAVASHGDVPSYFNGTCVLNGHSSYLGNYTVFRRADGKYAGYAHCLVGTRPDVGAKVKPGDVIYKAAGFSDDHGSQWTGPHCHTTVSTGMYGIYDGSGVDPWPSIKAAIATPKPILPKTTTSVTGSPGPKGTVCRKRVQLLAKRKGGYTGPLDGDLPDGGNSFKGLQRALKTLGFYHGDIDGKPRGLTVDAFQAWAGIPASKRTKTSNIWKLSAANWRTVGAKLNTLT